MAPQTFSALFDSKDDCFLAAEKPAAARFLAVEVQAGGPAARAARAESIDRLVAKLQEVRRLYPEAADLNPSTEPVIVGGIVSLIGNRLLVGQAERLPACESELVEFALAPYLGTAAAQRFARSPAPSNQPTSRRYPHWRPARPPAPPVTSRFAVGTCVFAAKPT